MATVTRFGNAYLFFHLPRNYTALLACISRNHPSRNILRTLSRLTMLNGECKNSLNKNCEFSTSAMKEQKNLVSSQEVHKVEEKWKRQFLDTKLFGEAVFVLGPMGAGKTTVIENEFHSHPVYSNYAYVDTDEIMGMIPHFTSDKVEQYYPIARGIAIRLTDWILEQRISFIAEGTCVKYMELIDYMQRLKTGGYLIRVKRLPKVPLDVVLKRSMNRQNRKVPEHVVKSIYFGSAEGLDSLYAFNKTNGLFEDIDEINDSCLAGKPIDSSNWHSL